MTSFMGKVFRGFVRKIFTASKKLRPNDLSAYAFCRVIVILTLLQTFFIESIQRKDVIAVLYWLAQNTQIFLINATIVLVITLFFISLTGSLQGTVFLSSLFFVLLSFSNMVKKQFLGDPLFPWDLFRVDQVLDLLPKLSGEIVITLIFLIGLAGALLFICIRLIPYYHLKWVARLSLMLGVLILVPLVIFYRHTPIQTAFKKADIEHLFWIQSENSLHNGFLLGFTMNLEHTMLFEPDNYSPETIEKIIKKNRQNTTAEPKTSQTLPEKPNVIVVLSESFWDPTQLPGVKFSEDPIPYFRDLRNKNGAGTMVSPVFGGSTANVEFEILTGLSTKFLPQGAIAYQLYIKDSLPALPQLFKDQGYAVTALHPYHKWFYQRDIIYPYLGFEHFYSLDDFAGAEIKGEYISDLEVSKKIIEQIDKTQEPAFIFAATMQNHGPYPEDRYPEKQITVSGNLSDSGKESLETYVQGLKDADESLRLLVEHYKKSAEPTVIVFFGDHLPFLGKDYQLYRETGYIEDKEKSWTPEENLKMKSVPFVVWSNYPRPIPDIKSISAQYLGLYLLDLAGLPDNNVFSFVRTFKEILPVHSKTVNLDNKNNLESHIPGEYQPIEDEYWLLEYDLLFGQKYYYIN